MSKQDNGNTKSLGNYIKFKREIKGLRLKDVAENAGMSIAYLNRLEGNKRSNPSFSILTRLANTLEVSILDLMQIHLKVNEPETKDIRDIILEGNYMINGKEVSEKIRIIIGDIMELALNNEWQEEKKFDMLSEELIRKVKYLNDLYFN